MSTPFPQAAHAPPPVGAEGPLPHAEIYAGFWRRVLAYVIDYALLAVVIVVIAAISIVHGQKGSPILAFVYLVLPLLYFVVLEASGMQGTLGKKAMGIKVADEAGNQISGARALGRYLGKVVSGLLFGIGFAMAGFTAKRQALHDMISGCVVVRSVADRHQIAQAPTNPRSAGYIAAMVVLMMLFGPFSLGVMAAIAIPAYQNYTIRSQITEGLTIGDGWKAAVAEHYAKTGKWPNTQDLDVTRPTGRYEQRVDIQSGAVVIVYGGQANPKISGKKLVLRPVVNSNNDVLWTCGLAKPPTGVDLTVDSAKYTTVGAQYLPVSCRS